MASVLIASCDIQGIHKFLMAETENILLAEGILLLSHCPVYWVVQLIFESEASSIIEFFVIEMFCFMNSFLYHL